MIRTRGQTQRRRALADASSGHQRAAVVLYACPHPDRPALLAFAELREHATARDWAITAEIADDAALHGPLAAWAGWPRIRELPTGQAHGVRTDHRPWCSPEEHHAAQVWMSQHGAFLTTVTTDRR